MLKTLFNQIKALFVGSKADIPVALPPQSIEFLTKTVAFYRALNEDDKRTFDKRILMFLSTTEIVGRGVEVDEHDRLLVAASAIIPVWAFTDWHYFNLQTVVLMPSAFNEALEHQQDDSWITGMVGNGPMHGKMLLSKPALHYGFINDKDKKNVGIHEFAHLIDMADGQCDGFPERMRKYAHFQPWMKFVEHKIEQIHQKNSNINPYGATNEQEFFAVTTEYFFERPELLKKKHPILYDELMTFYRQDTAAIKEQVQPKKNAPCPCGSGKKYKRCCLPHA